MATNTRDGVLDVFVLVNPSWDTMALKAELELFEPLHALVFASVNSDGVIGADQGELAVIAWQDVQVAENMFDGKTGVNQGVQTDVLRHR